MPVALLLAHNKRAAAAPSWALADLEHCVGVATLGLVCLKKGNEGRYVGRVVLAHLWESVREVSGEVAEARRVAARWRCGAVALRRGGGEAWRG